MNFIDVCMDYSLGFASCIPSWQKKSRIRIRSTRYIMSRGVHQTAQTGKIAPKPPAKWHNRITPQVIVYCTAPHDAVQFAVL